MELEWKEPIQIPDGKHTGEITRIEYRDTPFEYTDIFIKLDDIDYEIKYGCPSVASTNSKLGRVLQLFGAEFKAKEKINPETVLVGKRVELMTISKPSKKDGREYSEVVEDSLKPIIQEDEKKSTSKGPKTIGSYQA